jgi:hypothetical protein
MGWFQRYGIPGTVFCGFFLIWVGAFWYCEFDKISDDPDALKMVGVLIAAFFLPIGYFISVIGQIIYHWVPGIGIDTRARRRERIQFGSWADRWLEWRQESITVYQIMSTTAFSLDQIKWLLEWMSKRMDMIVINSSLILATVLAFCGALVFPCILGWDWQFHLRLFVFGWIVSVIIIVVCVISWFILTSQLVRVEALVFKRMADGRKDVVC